MLHPTPKPATARANTPRTCREPQHDETFHSSVFSKIFRRPPKRPASATYHILATAHQERAGSQPSPFGFGFDLILLALHHAYLLELTLVNLLVARSINFQAAVLDTLESNCEREAKSIFFILQNRVSILGPCEGFRRGFTLRCMSPMLAQAPYATCTPSRHPSRPFTARAAKADGCVRRWMNWSDLVGDLGLVSRDREKQSSAPRACRSPKTGATRAATCAIPEEVDGALVAGVTGSNRLRARFADVRYARRASRHHLNCHVAFGAYAQFASSTWVWFAVVGVMRHSPVAASASCPFIDQLWFEPPWQL